MLYAEQLPADCPPPSATEMAGEVVYRLVSSRPPSSRDFLSQRALFPNKSFHTDECRARAHSVFVSQTDCGALTKLPAHRSKFIARLTLLANAGKLMQTGRQASHLSWWRFAAFDPLAHCEVLEQQV